MVFHEVGWSLLPPTTTTTTVASPGFAATYDVFYDA